MRGRVRGATAVLLVGQDQHVGLGLGGGAPEQRGVGPGAKVDPGLLEVDDQPAAEEDEAAAVDQVADQVLAGDRVLLGDQPGHEGQHLLGPVVVERDLLRVGAEDGAAGLGVQAEEGPPALLGHQRVPAQRGLADDVADGVQGVEERLGAVDLGQHPVGVQQSGRFQGGAVVVERRGVDVQRQAVELAADHRPVPQAGVEVLAPHAVLRQQPGVEGVEQPARRETGQPAQVQHADLGRTPAGAGHGELGVVPVAPGQGGVLHRDLRVLGAELVEHGPHVRPVAAAEEVPEPHPVGIGGQRGRRSAARGRADRGQGAEPGHAAEQAPAAQARGRQREWGHAETSPVRYFE
ncbi:hypothetical protein [Streptomyces sp. B6B3]|uniref:hypothetical protein n=1 Tax=Streptomyces sp. B6B3 TaxID=3153570 RepID=UPI00325F3876